MDSRHGEHHEIISTAGVPFGHPRRSVRRIPVRPKGVRWPPTTLTDFARAG